MTANIEQILVDKISGVEETLQVVLVSQATVVEKVSALSGQVELVREHSTDITTLKTQMVELKERLSRTVVSLGILIPLVTWLVSFILSHYKP